MTIDRSIDALDAAFLAAGAEPTRPPSDEELARLDEIDRVVSPLRLPGDVRRLWERVDAYAVAGWVYPELTTPSFALDTWLSHRDEFPGMAPRALFLVGYTSWACMSVELAGPYGPGGAIFEWRLDSSAFVPRYESVSGWVDRLTHLLKQGSYERFAHDNRVRLRIEDEDTAKPLNQIGRALTEHPSFAGQTEIPRRDPEAWPPHWQRSSGIEPNDLRSHGATHTIAEVLASDPGKQLDATVIGRVATLAGIGSSTDVVVDDGTATLTIHCPASATMLGPSVGGEYEFDITLPPGRREGAPELATKRPDDRAEHSDAEIFEAMYFSPANAIATAVRPGPR